LPGPGALAPSGNETGSRALYISQCGVCHGDTLAGSPPEFLVLTKNQLASELRANRFYYSRRQGGACTGFPNLTAEQTRAISRLSRLTARIFRSRNSPTTGPLPQAMKYHLTGYNRFLDPDGYPAVAPPWGNSQRNQSEYWRIYVENSHSANIPNSPPQEMHNTGTEN